MLCRSGKRMNLKKIFATSMMEIDNRMHQVYSKSISELRIFMYQTIKREVTNSKSTFTQSIGFLTLCRKNSIFNLQFSIPNIQARFLPVRLKWNILCLRSGMFRIQLKELGHRYFDPVGFIPTPNTLDTKEYITMFVYFRKLQRYQGRFRLVK